MHRRGKSKSNQSNEPKISSICFFLEGIGPVYINIQTYIRTHSMYIMHVRVQPRCPRSVLLLAACCATAWPYVQGRRFGLRFVLARLRD